MTESEAADHGGRVAYLPMTEVDRAVAAGESRGFVKLIAGPRRVLGNAGGGRVLGATMVAARGGPAERRTDGRCTVSRSTTVGISRP
jgi:pyruvate/2-oxoglutarate dehydrogenase complex dihydrolipoamide dehydrogenase (E3) component